MDHTRAAELRRYEDKTDRELPVVRGPLSVPARTVPTAERFRRRRCPEELAARLPFE